MRVVVMVFVVVFVVVLASGDDGVWGADGGG
jgi:hypothetical protein